MNQKKGMPNIKEVIIQNESNDLEQLKNILVRMGDSAVKPTSVCPQMLNDPIDGRKVKIEKPGQKDIPRIVTEKIRMTFVEIEDTKMIVNTRVTDLGAK